jgi:hypothetical protein
VKRAQASDPVLSQVIARLRLSENRKQPSTGAVRTWLSKINNLFLDEAGLLHINFTQGRKTVRQLVVPETLIPTVLHMKHDQSGHMAAQKTRTLVQREYYWALFAR